MSWLEWIGESLDPGERGTIEVGGDARPSGASGPQVLLQLLLAGGLVAGGLWLVFGPLGVARSPENVRNAALALGCYLGLAWLIHPRPDRSNLGWCGGLVDDPFRCSDDWNRGLLWLALLLMPGRFVAECLVDAIIWPLGGRAARAPRVGRRRRPGRRG